LFDLDQRAFAFVFRPAMPPPTIDVVTGAVLSTTALDRASIEPFAQQ
jgi:hypothetical protein